MWGFWKFKDCQLSSTRNRFTLRILGLTFDRQEEAICGMERRTLTERPALQ